MERFWVPDRLKNPQGNPLELRTNYLTKDELNRKCRPFYYIKAPILIVAVCNVELHSVNLFTIQDLAQADKYTILKLRGFDFPSVPRENRLNFTTVCDKRALAIAVVKKCSAPLATSLYEGERQMPWNIVPEFGGPPPAYTPPAWYGTNWTFLQPPPTDDTVIVSR